MTKKDLFICILFFIFCSFLFSFTIFDVKNDNKFFHFLDRISLLKRNMDQEQVQIIMGQANIQTSNMLIWKFKPHKIYGEYFRFICYFRHNKLIKMESEFINE